MPEHTGEFVFRVDEHEQPARDVDVPTGQREGVRLWGVDDMELPGPLRSVGDGGELATDRCHVVLEFRIAQNAHRMLDLGRFFGAKLGDPGGADAPDDRCNGEECHLESNLV